MLLALRGVRCCAYFQYHRYQSGLIDRSHPIFDWASWTLADHLCRLFAWSLYLCVSLLGLDAGALVVSVHHLSSRLFRSYLPATSRNYALGEVYWWAGLQIRPLFERHPEASPGSSAAAVPLLGTCFVDAWKDRAFSGVVGRSPTVEVDWCMAEVDWSHCWWICRQGQGCSTRGRHISAFD